MNFVDFHCISIYSKSFSCNLADEVFRVFKKSHPDIQLKVENVSPILKPLILHVVDTKMKDRLTIG